MNRAQLEATSLRTGCADGQGGERKNGRRDDCGTRVHSVTLRAAAHGPASFLALGRRARTGYTCLAGMMSLKQTAHVGLTALVLQASLSACAGPRFRAAVRRQHAALYGCSADRVTARRVAPRTYAAQGCGQRAVYLSRRLRSTRSNRGHHYRARRLRGDGGPPASRAR